jgi:16S rRNA G966 N2-methylase RsmD
MRCFENRDKLGNIPSLSQAYDNRVKLSSKLSLTDAYALIAGTGQRTKSRDKRFQTTPGVKSDVPLPVGFVHGDFREVAHGLKDRCVDLIFTDPPYDRASAIFTPTAPSTNDLPSMCGLKTES